MARAAPEDTTAAVNVQAASPERPCRLHHRREHHDSHGVQTPSGAENANDDLSNCTGAMANGRLCSVTQLLQLPGSGAATGGP
eukprot:14416484-Alexandrium_andersonii.AAC.1